MYANLCKKVLFLLLILFSTTSSFAQILVKRQFGRVLDEYRKPIEYAVIRINNSTIFAESDSLGNFKIDIPENIAKIEFVVSRIGFETERREIKELYSKKIVFILKEDINLTELQVVKKKSNFLKRQIKIFKNRLLGTSVFATSCEILNEKDIVFDFSDKNKTTINFKENLKIKNNALGYILEIDIQEAMIKGDFFMPTVKSIFYQELQPKDILEQKKWIKNRETAFDITFRGFLCALIYNDYKDRYEVYQVNEKDFKIIEFPYGSKIEEKVSEKILKKVNLDTLAKYDTVLQKYIIESKPALLIFSLKHFSFQKVFDDSINEYTEVSFLDKNINVSGKIFFDRFGFENITDESSTLLHGFFAKNGGCATLLPQDYLPQKYK